MATVQFDEGTDSELLIAVLPIFAKLADSIATNHQVRDARRSYRHLQGWCLLVAKEVRRVYPFTRPGLGLFRELLDRLEDSVNPASPLKTTGYPLRGGHTNLISLYEWAKSRSNPQGNFQLKTACLWLGQESEEHLDKLVATLQSVFETFQVKYPEEGTEWTVENDAAKQARLRPVYTVGKAAQSVFQALLAATGGSCHEVHHYDARLFLATHRKREHVANGIEFDMFLSFEEVWQETQVCFESSPAAARIVVSGDCGNASAKKAPKKRALVRHLCAPMMKMRPWRSHRLNLAVENERLWVWQRGDSCFPIDPSTQPVTLEEFIEHHPNALTEMTKRILAVMLGHAVLHLRGTRWIRSSWGASDVLFHKVSSAVPIRPYIHVTLLDDLGDGSVRGKRDTTEGEDTSGDDDDFFGDDDFFAHPFPDLVTLGMLLIQIYLGKTLRSLAEELDIQDIDSLDNNTKYAVASQTFKKYSSAILFNAEKYWSAIDKCLDPNIHINEDGEEIDGDALDEVIYDCIIGPLEDELTQSNICSRDFVLSLDTEAPKLDLANLGQPIRLQPQPPSIITKFHPKSHKQKPDYTKEPLRVEGSPHGNPDQTRYSVPLNRQRLQFSTQDTMWSKPTTSLKFFDDEAQQSQITQEAREDYRSWRGELLDVYCRFLLETKHTSPPKIAVLDTGLDLGHPDFLQDADRRARVRDQRNFTPSADIHGETDVRDETGHGTATTGILLDLAPDALIYVAKIAEKEPSSCHCLADAVKHAVDEWDVDILSLSFGFASREEPGGYDAFERALEYASGRGKLIFAAASNSGANQRRAYPARHDYAICVHATAALGRPSAFNPPPEPAGHNFATIGEAVECPWPRALCDRAANPCCLAWKSGTSFATPVAAAVAAFLLRYAAESLDDIDLRLLRRPQGMRAVLREISRQCHGFEYIAPRVHPDHLFGKPKPYVAKRLSVVIRGS